MRSGSDRYMQTSTIKVEKICQAEYSASLGRLVTLTLEFLKLIFQLDPYTFCARTFYCHFMNGSLLFLQNFGFVLFRLSKIVYFAMKLSLPL